MTESVADRQRRHAALAERLLPQIVEGLRRGVPALEIAQGLEGQNLDEGNSDIDLKTVYRWTTIVEERLEKKRRRVGVRAAVILWLGFLALAGGVLGLVTAIPVPAPPVAAALGGALVAAGLAVWKVGKSRVGVSAEEIVG